MTHSDPPQSPQPPQPPQLAYERPSGITRGAFRLLLLLTLINTILLAANLLGPQHWGAVRNAYTGWKDRRAQAAVEAQRDAAQRAARVFQFPEKHVAYTEVPDEAMKLIAQGRKYHPISPSPHHSQGSPPTGWQAPVLAGPLAPSVPGDTATHGYGLLFLHERVSPNGSVALVRVAISADYQFNSVEQAINNNQAHRTTYSLSRSRKLHALALTPRPSAGLVPTGKLEMELVLPDAESVEVATVTHPRSGKPSTTQPTSIKRGNQLRLFGGTPDPADRSHFTIPYELDGRPGVIDGWLKDDALVLQPRQGRPVASAGSPMWELLPATNPATQPDPEARLLAIQEQCRAHALPAGTIAYTEDPAATAALAVQRSQYATIFSRSGSAQNWAPPIALKEPPSWTALRELSATFPVGYVTTKPYPMLFLHERTTPGGQRRVVVVQWVTERSYGGEVSRLLAGRMHVPASRSASAKLIDHVQVSVRLPTADARGGRPTAHGATGPPRREPLTLFAGQPDPNDASRFSIPYSIGESTGVIDGWATDDKLILQPRVGETSARNGQQTWVLGAAPPADATIRPASAPATAR